MLAGTARVLGQPTVWFARVLEDGEVRGTLLFDDGSETEFEGRLDGSVLEIEGGLR